MPSLGFSIYSIMSSANSDSFTSSFPICIPYLSFSSLISMTVISKAILNSSGKSGHPCLIPDLRGNAFSFSPLRVMFQLVCHIWPLLCWGSSPLCPLSWEFCFFFNHKWILNFVKRFLCIYWDDHIVFILQFVNLVYHIHWFVYIEESLHPWDKYHLIMVYDHFNVLFDSLC